MIEEHGCQCWVFFEEITGGVGLDPQEDVIEALGEIADERCFCLPPCFVEVVELCSDLHDEDLNETEIVWLQHVL